MRLDARLLAPEKPSTHDRPPVTERAASEPVAQERRFRWPLMLVVALAAVLFAILRPGNPAPAMLAAEYGLTADDILGEHPETAAMVVEALQSDAIGERGRGASLLEAVHRSDTRTPVPALFLAIWTSGEGQREAADSWLGQARARLGDHRNLYLNLLADYVAVENEGSPEQIIHAAGAVLDLRPDAWRMRHARAHLFEYSGMREAALREISQIQVNGLGHRKLAMVIADRASMGDVDGAQSVLDGLSGDEEPAMYAFLNGRVAWSRGDFAAAHGHFLEAAASAHEFARLDILRQSLNYAGTIEAMEGRDDQALQTLDRARGQAVTHSRIDEIDLSLSIAQLHQLAGRDADADVALDRALALTNGRESGGVELLAQITAMRMHPGTLRQRPESLPPEWDALWDAAELASTGDVAGARQALTESLNRGVLDTRLADEARWLELRLGLPLSPEAVIDPPYPPLSRVVLRREIRKAQAERGEYAGLQRP